MTSHTTFDPLSMIFVFGSNLEGRHGAGAAAAARQVWGAEHGVGVGATGNAYALPTKATPKETLPLETVAGHVRDFLAFAADHPDRTFMVTRIGCGLAGFRDEEIEPLFQDAPENCLLPGIWLARRNPRLLRLIVAGGRDYPEALVDDGVTWLNWAAQRSWDRDLEVVCGMANGADALGHFWADLHRLPVARFPAPWEQFKRGDGYINAPYKAAGTFRNQWMAWYGTHLAAFWDGASRGTRNMIETAKAAGLSHKTRHFQLEPGDERFRYDPEKGPDAVIQRLGLTGYPTVNAPAL